VSPVAKKVSEHLARRLGVRKYDMWFGPSTRFRVDGERLEVTAESQRVADWIGLHFERELFDVARQTIGDSATVDVRVDESAGGERDASPVSPDPAPEPRTRRVPVSPAMATASRRPDLHLPLRHRLQDFVVGPSNKLAYSAALTLAEGRAEDALGPVFVYGECGLGKTHLLQGTCRRHLERFPAARVRYTTGEQFTNEYITAVKASKLDEFRRKVRNLDLLAIDDIHFLSNKTATQSEFLHTLDAIDFGGARIVMASDEHPRHLRSVSRALVSRFLAGMVVEVERPDREMRLELVKRLAAMRGLQLNDGAVELMAANCVASVREIEGSLTKLAAMRLVAGPDAAGEIGCVLVERLFKTASNVARPLRIGLIVDAVCERLGVDKSELLGSTRHKRVVMARGIISYLARDLTTMSYPEIGRAIGRRNHSTVLTAGRRIAAQIEANETIDLDGSDKPLLLRELVDQLRHAVRRSARA